MRALMCLAAGVGSLFLAGCDPKEKESWDLQTASNGFVYRINKNTGEVSLVAGAQITTLEEFHGTKTEPVKRSYVRQWPLQTVKSLGDISLHLKTTWRDGKLHYVLSVAPISLRLQKAKETPYSEARFNMGFCDAQGFELFTLPVKIGDMSEVVDDAGKAQSITATGSTTCSVETYEALAVVGIGWAAFPKESQ